MKVRILAGALHLSRRSADEARAGADPRVYAIDGWRFSLTVDASELARDLRSALSAKTSANQ